MPKMSGREVLKRLRGAGCGTPIRRLTAKGEIEDQIQNTCERLPDVQPDKLFDRFYRTDAARTQKSVGYGIGLSAARSIVDANRQGIDPCGVCQAKQYLLYCAFLLYAEPYYLHFSSSKSMIE